MTKLKLWSLNDIVTVGAGVLVILCAGHWVSAAEISRSLVQSGGGAYMQADHYALNTAFGEATASDPTSSSRWTLQSGYFAGGWSAGDELRITAIHVDAPHVLLQPGIVRGVPLNADVLVELSTDPDLSTIQAGLLVQRIRDNLAQTCEQATQFDWSYNSELRQVRLSPKDRWYGNSVYRIQANSEFRSEADVTAPEESSYFFQTIADPHDRNVFVQWPGAAVELGRAAGVGDAGLRLTMPEETLPDYAMVSFEVRSADAEVAVDADVLREANARARASGGDYRQLLGYLQVAAIDGRGDDVLAFRRNAEVSMNLNQILASSISNRLVRNGAVSLWALDRQHRMWVKMPDSRSGSGELAGIIGRPTLYAIMAAASQNANDVHVYPMPWRPFGPQSGDGAGETGTLATGITFTQLPSECKIRIFNLAGERVRELSHSDISGLLAQERWDVRDDSGRPAASGVYLWHVQSAGDQKTGKLIVVR
jgi:hypothetical protein